METVTINLKADIPDEWDAIEDGALAWFSADVRVRFVEPEQVDGQDYRDGLNHIVILEADDLVEVQLGDDEWSQDMRAKHLAAHLGCSVNRLADLLSNANSEEINGHIYNCIISANK